MGTEWVNVFEALNSICRVLATVVAVITLVNVYLCLAFTSSSLLDKDFSARSLFGK